MVKRGSRARGRATTRRKGGDGGGLVALAVAIAAVWIFTYQPDLLDMGGLDEAPSGAAVADIPPPYLALYRSAAGTCPELHWSLLAGVGKVETDHGRSPLPGVRSGTNYAGAAGPMQFLYPTWAQVRRKHPEIGPNIYDPAHAIPGAARYLCDGGLNGGDVRAALWTYNHSTAYANQVLDQAARYRKTAAP